MKRYGPSVVFLAVLLFLWQFGAGMMNAAYILPTPTGDFEKALGAQRTPVSDPSAGNDESHAHRSADFCGARYRPGSAHGCEPGDRTGAVPDCDRFPDHSDNGDRAPFCRMVWLWHLE